MNNIKIFICAHKEVPLPQHPFFFPVQAGATLHEHIRGYQPDDEGDNWNYIDVYSERLFNILFEVEHRVPPIDNPTQSCIYVI